jgi:putative membrane protein
MGTGGGASGSTALTDLLVCPLIARLIRKEGNMSNEAIHKQLPAQSDPRVQLAFERTFLAYERTRIAWVRTALALISFGFAIAKVLQYLREKQGETATVMSPRAIGLGMISIGLVSLILADRQERRALKALRDRCPQLPRPIAGVVAVLIALLGVLALIGAILR